MSKFVTITKVTCIWDIVLRYDSFLQRQVTAIEYGSSVVYGGGECTLIPNAAGELTSVPKAIHTLHVYIHTCSSFSDTLSPQYKTA